MAAAHTIETGIFDAASMAIGYLRNNCRLVSNGCGQLSSPQDVQRAIQREETVSVFTTDNRHILDIRWWRAPEGFYE